VRRRSRPLPKTLAELASDVADAAPAKRCHGARYALIPWELVEEIRSRRIADGLDPEAPLVVDVCSNAGREGRFMGWFRNVKARMA
jgi:hypothetical protein